MSSSFAKFDDGNDGINQGDDTMVDTTTTTTTTTSSGSIQDETDNKMDLNELIQHLGFGKFQWRLLILCGFCWMADAMELMILSFLSPTLLCEWKLTREQEAMISTFVFLGMLCGASCWGWVSDRYGRRKGFLATTIFAFVFGLASAFAPNLGIMCLLRFLTGFGVAGAHVAFTLFAEFLPGQKRGRALLLIELFWALGAIASSGLAASLIPSGGWRVYIAVSALPSLMLALAWKFVPESPRYLASTGDIDGAKQVLRTAAKMNGVQLPANFEIDVSSTVDDGDHGSFKDLLSIEWRKTTLLLWFIWFVMSFVYYGGVLMVTEFYVEEAAGRRCAGHVGYENVVPIPEGSGCQLESRVYTDVLINSIGELPGLMLTAALINRGRKQTLMFETAAAGVGCLVMLMCIGVTMENVVNFVIRATISGAFQALFVYTPEVYPTHVRSVGLGTCSSASRIGGMTTPIVAQVLVQYGTAVPMTIYAVSAFMAVVCIYYLPIDTNAHSMGSTPHPTKEMSDVVASGNNKYSALA